MIKNLRHFVGKACSVFTVATNRNLREEESYYYFVGVVEEVDDRGIFMTQLTTGLKSYFFLNNLVAICEEQVLDPEKDAEIIDKIKSKTTDKIQGTKDK